MAFGIQITKSDNASLLNSFWLLDEANQQARCLCVKDNAFKNWTISKGFEDGKEILKRIGE